MGNAKEHALLGFVFGAGIYCVAKWVQDEEIDWGNALGWGVVGAGVALLPDIIEPATSPMHRAFAHSLVTGGVVAYTTKKAWESPDLTSEQKAVVTSLASAYLSHLVLDSTTPAGLPVI